MARLKVGYEASPVLDLAIVAGFLLFGYLFYLAIWRLVTPKRWAEQCPECRRYDEHRFHCSHRPPSCARCRQTGGRHLPICTAAPIWQQIGALLLLLVVGYLRWRYDR